MARTYQRRHLLTTDHKVLAALGKVQAPVVPLLALRDLLAMNHNTFRHTIDRLVARKFVVCSPGYMGTITSAGRAALVPDLHALVASIR